MLRRDARTAVESLIALIVALLTGAGLGTWPHLGPIPPVRAEAPAPSTSSAGAALDRLPVKGKAPATGYSRAQFGPEWTDATARPMSRDGCDTRSNVVGRDSINATFKPGTRDCVVLTSTITDPYTGRTFTYHRGDSSASVDHAVALKNAWLTGAQQLTLQERTELANDPANLVTVSSNINSAKGASDASSWLPPNKSHRCAYAARQIAIKTTYRLWVTKAEKDALDRVLTPCPDQPLPPVIPLSASASAASPNSSATTPSEPFASCAQARAAGAAPLSSTHPRWSPRLDGDRDGQACEASN